MPKIFDEKHHRRKSIRLPFYDYSQDGMYFITMCVQNRACILGKIENGEMIKNDLGKMVEKCWNAIPEHFPNVILDAFVVMPNHIHGIIRIENNVGVQNFEPLHQNQFQHIIPRSIGSIVRGFKIGVTKYTKTIDFSESIWQRNYHEHIIRNEQSYEKIAEYIFYNPQKWDDDMFFVDFC